MSNDKSYYIQRVYFEEEPTYIYGKQEMSDQNVEIIWISKKSFILATVRSFPTEHAEVEEIIKYSEGQKIKLSIFERIMVWLKQ